MRPPKNTWPDTPASRGTLFFAQAMEAFLDDHSFEGFRAYSLDTVARLEEVYQVAEDVKLKRVARAALRSVLDELFWSLENDEAIKQLAAEEASFLRVECGSQLPDPDALQQMVSMLQHRVGPDYRAALRDQVVLAVNEEKRRIALLKATGFLVSHLVNEGHSKRFLLERLREKFFTAEIRKAGAAVVRGFIDAISAERRRYKVVCGISTRTATLLNHMGGFDIHDLADLPPHAQAAITAWPDFDPSHHYLVEVVQAADRYRAVSQVNDRLTAIKDLMVIPRQRLELSRTGRFYAFSPRGIQGESIQQTYSTLESPTLARLAGRRLKQITRVPRQIEQDFDELSRERLTSAISTAAVAFETTVSETRLISLWSAFEVLLSDPPDDEARISHYASRLTPCIALKYHRRLFAAVHDQLAISFRLGLRRVLDRIGEGDTNSHTRFAELLVLPDYEEERQELLNRLSKSPLALHRVFRLHKHYGTPEAAVKTIAGHSMRVEWQLNRIYRARNNLVHAGRSPLYLDSLVLNALEYFRSALIAITRRAQQRGGVNNVDQMVAEIGFDLKMQLARLEQFKRGDPFTREIATRLFCA